MARNIYFTDKVRSEHELYENLVIESLKIYGQDVYYIPRDIVNEDKVFGDDIESSFNSSYKVEMYLDNVEGFEGEGDLFTRFGVEIRDECTFVVARRRWSQTVARYDNDISSERPREGDLVYLPLSNSLFQITHVEHEMPFYQVSNLNVYKLRAQLFEYTGEDLDTGVEAIDDIEKDFSYQYKVTVPRAKTATASVTQDSNGLITGLTLTDSGAFYTLAPTISFIGGTPLDSATATATLTSGGVSSISLDSSGYYTTDSAVTVRFTAPPSTLVSQGDSASQTLASGVKVTGELIKYSDSDGILYIAHVGADDGKYHSFVTGRDIRFGSTSNSYIRNVTAVSEDNRMSENEQNDDFSTVSDDFLDFTEDNPFGDPENN